MTTATQAAIINARRKAPEDRDYLDRALLELMNENEKQGIVALEICDSVRTQLTNGGAINAVKAVRTLISRAFATRLPTP